MNTIQRRTFEIINDNIENSEITFGQEEDLTQFGVDSITFIRIIVAIEEEFDLEIPDEYLLVSEMNTVSKIVDVISATLNIKEHSKNKSNW